jgi:hypothetical protein
VLNGVKEILNNYLLTFSVRLQLQLSLESLGLHALRIIQNSTALSVIQLQLFRQVLVVSAKSLLNLIYSNLW